MRRNPPPGSTGVIHTQTIHDATSRVVTLNDDNCDTTNGTDGTSPEK